MDETQARWPIAELARRVAAALAVGYDGPGNARVRGIPDVRSIRWYATIGLLDKPAGYRGRTALYGPRHLRQLVAVKRRQATGAALADIQAELTGASDDELARLAMVPPDLLDTVPTRLEAHPTTAQPPPGDADAARHEATSTPAGAPPPPGTAESPSTRVGTGDAGCGRDDAGHTSAGAQPTPVAPSPGDVDSCGDDAGPTPAGPGTRAAGSVPGAVDDGSGRAGSKPGVGLAGVEAGTGEPTFWKTQPINVAVNAARHTASPSSPALSYGVRLAEGLTVLIDATHQPTEADLEAVRAAAQPLLRVVRARGLSHTGVTP